MSTDTNAKRRGWYVVDESTQQYFDGENWTQRTAGITQGVRNSDKTFAALTYLVMLVWPIISLYVVLTAPTTTVDRDGVETTGQILDFETSLLIVAVLLLGPMLLAAVFFRLGRGRSGYVEFHGYQAVNLGIALAFIGLFSFVIAVILGTTGNSIVRAIAGLILIGYLAAMVVLPLISAAAARKGEYYQSPFAVQMLG